MAFQRFVFATDIHGSHLDKAANEALFRHCEKWKPTIRVCGGDLYNFGSLRKGACEDERRESMQTDYAAGNNWLDRFRPTHFLRGNHDERLFDWAQQDNGPASDLARIWVREIEERMRREKCRMLPYHKRNGVLRIGHLKMLHGYACGVGAARKHAWTYGSCLFGHVHSIDHATLERMERTMARSVGALCQLDQDYNRAHIASLRHAHGWAYGVINDRSGTYNAWQAERIGNKWMLPTGIEEL